MKNLNLVSFVGVDTNTNLDGILQFKSDIPCEWSVLFSDSKSLTANVRYPSFDFCQEFLKWGRTHKQNCSLHLCGSVIQRFLNKDKQILDLCADAQRIQLNLNIKDYPDHSKLSDNIWSVLKSTDFHIILQQNKTKSAFMKTFLDTTIWPVSILHDGSGGFGREISQVETLKQLTTSKGDHYLGYAGGIKPENVVKIVDLIEKNNPNNIKYYIDMESGIRTDNIFSLEKCRQVIQNLTVVE